MSLTKYAEHSGLEVLDAFVVPKSAGLKRLARMRRRSHRHNFEYNPRPGYIYVRSRAISSRCNDNYDEFPAEEIKKAYRTFIGKPVFVNHHNADHRRARGVIIDAALHEDINPDGTEDTWAEVLMEVDAVRFPVLAREVLKGNIARTSMGTDVEYSVCTACGNKAYTPADYCQHIPRMKGLKVHRTLASGAKEEVLVAERCYGLGFFENSLLVEDPADPTAFVLGVEEGGMSRAAAKAIIEEDEQITRDAGIFDVLRGGNDPRYQCPECGSLFRWTPALHQFTCPKGHATSPAAFASVRRTAARGEVDRIEDLEVGDPVMYRHDEIGARPLIDGTVVANDGHEVTISDNTNPSIRQQIDNDELDRDDWTVRRARRAVEALMREAASLDSGAPCTACSLADMNEQPHEGCTGCACAEVGHDSSALLKRNRQRSTEWLSDRFREQEGREGRVSRTASRSAVADLLRAEAYGETKAPAKVDTMRAENCPVCGDDEGFNGDKCNVCGYVQPPSQFRDPDLGKAQEVDLRQEQQEQAGMDPTAPEEAIPGQEDEGSEDLQCTNCGEVFSAEGDSATGSDPDADPEEPEAKEAEPEHPDDTEDGDSPKAGQPDDLSDLADTTDEDLFDDEDDEEDEPEQDEPEDPASEDPAVGEGRITAEPEDDGDTTLGGDISEGETCPVCGEGTLVAVPPQPVDDNGEPKTTEVGTDPTRQKMTSASRRGMSKETVDMNQPNPAQKRRNRIIAAIREQQGVIEQQQQMMALQHREIVGLREAVATLAVAAGVGNHPKFARLVRQAGVRLAADNEAPATSTQQAAQPEATDDVESVGAVPGSANDNVTPEAVTDVNNSDVTVNPPVLDNLQDVTAPVAGTDAVVPDAGDAGSASQVTVGTPSNEAFDKPEDSGWKTSARGSETERFVASMRLARLRVAAGIEQGEDLALAEKIASGEDTLGEIVAQANALSAVAARQSRQPDPSTRHLVPRAAASRSGVIPVRQQPSMQATAAATTSRSGEDEWMVGNVD